MKTIIKIFAFVFLAGLISSCTFNGPETSVQPGDKRIPHSPSPANGATDQPLAVILRWQAEGVPNFDVYFDTKNPPGTLKEANVPASSMSLVVAGLQPARTYYWRVVSKLSDGTKLSGPVWYFSTKSGSAKSGYVMVEKQLYTELPHIVNILFQVLDFNGKGVDFLTTSDFELYEDGEKISESESQMQIFKKGQTPFELRTVLMLDNSTSLGPDIDQMKSAAKDFVNNLVTGQKVAVYKFSEKPVLIQDFTDNVSQLISAINSITLGYATTDLYGAVIEGASRLIYKFDSDQIIQSDMILFTDGKDTQGSHTLSEAVNAISGKSVYTVGLGTDIDPEVLNILGTSGFYSIGGMNELSATFNTIEQDLNKYANSFYWLRYRSPKRGPNLHTLVLKIVNNPNTGDGSAIIDQFSSAGFFSVDPGLYFNSSAASPEGIDTLYLFRGQGAKIVQAASYLTANPPAFSWSQPDTNIAKIKTYESDNSRAEISPGNNAGITSTLVTDVNNPGVSKRLFIKVN